jgi:novobiocin biosynthesis protein NovU/D-mycarose 3-C-methyltransferase
MAEPGGAHLHCRVCGTALPPPFLDLGAMPLANAFLESPAAFAGERAYPLAVRGCHDCGLVQLDHVVPAEILYRDYIYVSATSEAVRRHAEELAERSVRTYGWGERQRLVEIASNDGTVLKAFQKHGVRVLGVEPARNIAAVAVADGVPTVAEFFTEATARALRAHHGAADGILARHVFAHVDDVHDFLEGAAHLLTPDGVLMIEVPYLGDLLEGLEFDTIYHEHLSYIALSPVERLCAAHRLAVVDVEPVSLHGGSVIVHIARGMRSRTPSPRVAAMRDAEQRRRVSDPATWAAFAKAVTGWRREFHRRMDELAGPGARIVGYGAAAKANTLLNYCPEVARALVCILDRSPYKHGRYTPGTHIRVEPVEALDATGASHILILAWNFQEEIIRQMRPFAARGGRFIVPLPIPRVV